MRTYLFHILYILGLTGSLIVTTSVSAQTATITPSTNTYAAAGGTVTFTVTLNYTGAASALGFSVLAPSNWTFGTAGGTNPPEVIPNAGDTGELDFAWISMPTGPVSFTFTASYTAGFAGIQDFRTPTGIFRISGVATNVTLPDVIFTPIPGISSARLINISTRAQVGTGPNIIIPGFVISGGGNEQLLVRADGPGLAHFGVTGVLAQPSLSIFDNTGKVIASNTGWGTNSNPALIASTATAVGAFALQSGSADCALIVNLPAGAYTAQVSGVNNTTGVALAEIYEVSSSGTRLINISTRAQVGTGPNIIIPGFVISGGGNEQMLVRADGPSLAHFGVTGVLAQPSLSIFDNTGKVIASNTGWGTNSNPALIASTATAVGAFALQSGSADSAQVVNLAQGAYTMQISGVNSTTGVSLAEVYEVPSGP